MGEGVDNGGADAKTSERAWARHEGNLGDVLPIVVVFLEFIMEPAEKLFG